tara:strand:+ start:4764 stop:5150 length:387 start_codon:yes stop_codon:yes gene_type:complete
MKYILIIFFYLIIVLPANSENSNLVKYSFTAKELVIECEAMIPGETAAQQEFKREVPCIRYIQSTINTYQFIKSKSNNKDLLDLCLSNILNLQRHKDVFVKYVRNNPNKEQLDASEIIIESLNNSYCK